MTNWLLLSEARNYVMGNRDDKTNICPCCDGPAVRYKRKFNEGMAYWLCRLVLQYKKDLDWTHIREIRGRPGAPRKSVSEIGGDFAKIRYWELVEPKMNEDSTKRCSGVWRPTDSGINFAHGQFSIPMYAITWLKDVEHFEGDMITMREALGEFFDYEELMRDTPDDRKEI